MAKTKRYVKGLLIGLPIVTIIGASFLPLRTVGSQFLVLITLVWFMTYILFDVFVR